MLKVEWQKLRGRGDNAPERLYGPDGILQLELFDEVGNVIARKCFWS